VRFRVLSVELVRVIISPWSGPWFWP